MHCSIRFDSRRALSASQFMAKGNRWEPDLHFTGTQDPMELRLIEELLSKYGHGVVAYFIYAPFPGTYSVELQFGSSDEDQKALAACRTEFHGSFDRQGKIKLAVMKRLKSLVQ